VPVAYHHRKQEAAEAVRDSFATALGALAACAASAAAAAAVAALKPSSPKHKAACKLRDNALHRCLVAPLAAACADRPSGECKIRHTICCIEFPMKSVHRRNGLIEPKAG
jgi:hypothetical protein